MSIPVQNDGDWHKGNQETGLKLIGSADQVPQKRFCKCRRSNCLKLYCECFAVGIYCADQCNCGGCYNNLTNESIRRHATEHTLERNPNAFRSKIQNNVSVIGSENTNTVGHFKGCQCKKSFCLKKYCECFQSRMFCTPNCRCLQCKNIGDHSSEHNEMTSSADMVETTTSSIPIKFPSEEVVMDGEVEPSIILSQPTSEDLSQQEMNSEIPPLEIIDKKSTDNIGTAVNNSISTTSSSTNGSMNTLFEEGVPATTTMSNPILINDITNMKQIVIPKAPKKALIKIIENTPGLYLSLLKDSSSLLPSRKSDDDDDDDTDEVDCDNNGDDESLSLRSNEDASVFQNDKVVFASPFLSEALNQSVIDKLCIGFLKASENTKTQLLKKRKNKSILNNEVDLKDCIQEEKEEEDDDVNMETILRDRTEESSKRLRSDIIDHDVTKIHSNDSSASSSSVTPSFLCYDVLDKSHLLKFSNDESSSLSWHDNDDDDDEYDDDNRKNDREIGNYFESQEEEVGISNTESGLVEMHQSLAVLQHLSLTLRRISTSLTDKRGGIPPYR